jgi:hypothetical protein
MTLLNIQHPYPDATTLTFLVTLETLETIVCTDETPILVLTTLPAGKRKERILV